MSTGVEAYSPPAAPSSARDGRDGGDGRDGRDGRESPHERARVAGRAFFALLRREFLQAVRDRRELAANFGYALLGPLLVAFMLGALAERRAADAPVRFAWCAGEVRVAALESLLLAQGAGLDAAAPACLAVPTGAEARLAAGEPVHVAVRAALEWDADEAARLASAAQAAARTVAEQRLLARGLAPAVAVPLRVEVQDTGTMSARAAALAGGFVLLLIAAPFFLCQAVAIDATAGERERRTLEPLLAAPVPPAAVLLAKFAVAAGIGLAGSGLAIALGFFALARVPLAALELPLRLDAGSAVAAWIWLVPLVLAVAATYLALGLWSRSYKEGQSYGLLLSLAPLAIGFAALFEPGVAALVQLPVVGELALLRGALLGTGNVAGAGLALVLVELAIAGLMLAAAARRLAGEDVLGDG